LNVGTSDKLIVATDAMRVCTLVAGQSYFGLEAEVLRAGAERVLVRIATQGQQPPQVDVRSLGEDFGLDAAATLALLKTWLAGGLLYPDGAGRFRPTGRLRAYAHAQVVEPLWRERARDLVDDVRALAARINANWAANPFQIDTMAVSGSYMSLRDPLPELALSLVLRPRPDAPGRRRKPQLKKNDGARQILAAVKALSSFIEVRIVADRQPIPRPFSVVFEFTEDMRGTPLPAWDRLRDWSASIARELASKSEVATRSLASALLRERHLPWHYQVVTHRRSAMRNAAGRGAPQQ
jgi:hypothetical protein